MLTNQEAEAIQKRNEAGEKIIGEELERYRAWVRFQAEPVIRNSPYRHFKSGDVYVVLGVALNSKTLRVEVIYMNSGGWWTRPLFAPDGFRELVEHEGKQVRRFESVLAPLPSEGGFE